MQRDSYAFELSPVERADPEGPPIAFRIWVLGENPTDHGITVYSERSALLLMTEQALRANLYPIDVNHMSIDPRTPICNQRAVGWHRLEARADGLWAVQIEWDSEIAKGLTSKPPQWRYFSPAYDQDPNTGEVTRYLNLALTNTPATWHVTELAKMQTDMSKKEVFAALRKLSETDKDSEAGRVIAALLAMEDIKAVEDGPPPPPPPKGEEPDGDEPVEEEDTKAKAKFKKATVDPAIVRDMAVELETIKAKMQAEDVARERALLLASRPDLSKPVVEWLSKSDLPTVRDAIAAIPKSIASVRTTEVVTPTLGSGQARSSNSRDAQLPAEEHAALMDRMGVGIKKNAIHWDANRPSLRVFDILTPKEAAEFLAARKATGGDK